MSDPLHIFGETMRQVRQQRGHTQDSLADLTGLHRTYIGGIERGERNLSLANIVKLANALRVRPADLMRDIA